MTEHRIRRLAKRLHLVANKSRRDHQWYLTEPVTNAGLTAEQAAVMLTSIERERARW
jgi:hypothetical protein